MKDKKVNISVGYEKLTKEEINSHKNFDELQNNYLKANVKPMKVAKKYTFTKVFVVASVTTIVTVCIWKYIAVTRHITGKPTTTQSGSQSSSRATAKSSDGLKKRPFIHPPVKGINVPYKSYTMDAAKGGVINYNKSAITVPPGAFCDEKGNEIKGSVQINYREFHDVVDFFVSGIPMTYDSAGKIYNFESAGMLDISGTQNGKKVYIKQGKNLQVAMSSFQTGKKYNVYQLDTVKKNWTYIENSRYVVKTTVTKIQNKGRKTDSLPTPALPEPPKLTALKQEEKKLESSKPLKPAEAGDDAFTFYIESDNKEFPELSGYRNMTFEVDASNKDFKPEWVDEVWSDAKLSREGSERDYIFTVSRQNEKHEILVHPVFKGKNYAEAVKEYDQKYSDYQAKLEQKKEEEKKEKEAYNKMMAEYQKKRAEETSRQLALLKKQQEANVIAEARMNRGGLCGHELQETDVVNYLNLNKFGIYNCDNPNVFPVGAELAPNYTDNLDENLNNNNIFLVEKDRNAIIEYYPGHHCIFNPLERNFAWTVTPDHKLAVYREQDFRAIPQRNGDFTFVLKVLDKDINNVGDIRDALKPYM